MTGLSAAQSADSNRYTTLDGMRGVAALGVALYHWGFATAPLARPGYLAVDFFFALSGFVIAFSYTARLEGTLGAKEFMALRLIRFYPLYLLGHCLGIARNIALQISGSPNARSGLEFVLAAALGFFMLPVPLDVRNLFPLNPPAWTLFLELVVNIIFALGMFRWSSRVLALIMLFSALMLVLFTSAPLFLDVGYSLQTLSLGVARLGFSFPLGIIMFRLFGSGPRRRTPLALLAPAVLVLCLLFTTDDGVRGLWEFFCVFALFPALLAAGIRFEVPRNFAPFFDFMGGISYAVYAIHGPLILFIYKITETLQLGRASAIVAYLFVLILLSFLASKFFDQPVRAYIGQIRRKRLAKLAA